MSLGTRRRAFLGVGFLGACALGSGGSGAGPPAAASPAAPPAAAAKITFKDVAAEWGLTFVHDMSMTPVKYMVETMGSGGGFVDYDRDGDLDVYLQNGRPMPGYTPPRDLHAALYRNDGGLFVDVTAETGTGHHEFGMGVCAGDYDNDGYQDLYVANWGPDVLYHNEGNGRFTDATRRAGVAEKIFWGSSCAFLDYDGDSDLDVWVTNYVDASIENNKFCGDYIAKVRAYCHPNVYNGQRDFLYRNNGDGTFTDAAEEAGADAVVGNGLGIVTGDYDDDGDLDVYVANDKSPNVLYRNDGGRFTDVTLLAGVGFGLDGLVQAGMGTDFGDYDADGDLDIVVTNLDFENNSLYRNEGGGIFSDASFPAGIGGLSMSYVGFGAKFADYDNDGLLDLVVANGHILDNAPYFNDATTFAQRNFVHRNRGDGTFEEVGASLGPDMAAPNVGRGLSVGDVDLDGDLDLLVTVCNGRPRLFRNDGAGARGSVRVRLAGTASNRDAIGARVTVAAGGRSRFEEVKSGSSYQSQSDTRLLFGLGGSSEAESLEVRWPSGRVDRFEHVAPGAVTLVEGEGSLRR